MVPQFIQKTIITAITLLLVVYLGYGLMTKPVDTTVIPDLSTTETASQDILNLVYKMEKISIDPSIFSSPLFTRLIDLSPVITPEAKGRPNPFAPIGSDQVISQTVSVNTSAKKTQ